MPLLAIGSDSSEDLRRAVIGRSHQVGATVGVWDHRRTPASAAPALRPQPPFAIRPDRLHREFSRPFPFALRGARDQEATVSIKRKAPGPVVCRNLVIGRVFMN